MSLISASGSGGRLSGMRSVAPRRAGPRSSGLSAPLPGTTAGPPLPPLKAAAAVSSRSPPRGLAAPWQHTQCRVRIGLI